MMIGDMVFNGSGRPGIVVGKDSLSGELVVEDRGEKFEAARHKGYLNGLSIDDRRMFNEVIEKSKHQKNRIEKLKLISEEIDRLKKDPKNTVVTNYLEGEKAHIMHSEGISLGSYRVQEKNLR